MTRRRKERPVARGRGGAGQAPELKKTLDRALSVLGVCSRGAARAWIAAGWVRVDGLVVRDPERWVVLGRAVLSVDGKPVAAAEKLYVALHKPRGYVTSFGDPGGRPTVYELLAGVPAWLGPVGRLDLETSGLLLFTNDTAFAERVTNPTEKLSKVYEARARPALAEEALAALRRGVELDDGPTRPAGVRLLRRYAGYCVVELTLTEGRNRQVRRMLRAVGSKVERLKRVAIGPVALGDLPSGKWRRLTEQELARLGVPRPRRRAPYPPSSTRRTAARTSGSGSEESAAT